MCGRVPSAERFAAPGPGVWVDWWTMKLVLEGGGVRAAYSAGVMHSLREAGVIPAAVVGSSTGSLNAAFVASGQTDVACAIWTDEVPGDRFISWRRQFTPWGKPGLDLDAMIDEVILPRLDVVAATSGRVHLYVTATDVRAGEAVVARPTPESIGQWLRASFALPVGYNRIVEVEGRPCIDGGVLAPVAFDVPLPETYAGPTVAVLTRPIETAKPAPALWARVALRTIVPPGARELSLRQHELHNAQMKKLQDAVRRGEVLLVDPPPDLGLSRLTRDSKKIRRGVELGRRVGEGLARRLGA